MKLKNLLFTLLVWHGFFAKSQDVLDGVYVKEHVPAPKRLHYVIYPIQLKYTFDDDRNFNAILKQKLAEEKSKNYPVLNEYVLIDFPLKQVKQLIAKDTAIAQKIRKERIEERKKSAKHQNYQYKDPATRVIYEKPLSDCHSFFRRIVPHGKYEAENLSPTFLKFHLANIKKVDTNNVKSISAQVLPFLNDYLSPFYIKKSEVSNLEYRTFVTWVRDSIIRTILVKKGFTEFGYENKENGAIYLKWKTDLKPVLDWSSLDEKYKDAIKEIYLPENQRYYRRKEIDVEKLVYDYTTPAQKRYQIGIYPDTLAWSRDFPPLYNHPKPNMYFWHPAYNESPVVGLTIEQIEAFLAWKTKMYNMELHRKGLKHHVSFSLPNEMHWELAACYQLYAERKQENLYTVNAADNSYTCNLSLNADYDTVNLREYDSVNAIPGVTGKIDILYMPAVKAKSNQVFDWEHLHTYPPTYPYDKNTVVENKKGVYGLNNNVSEWTSEIAYSNYLALLNLRWQILESYKSRELYLLAQTEKMHYEQTTSGTQLVRGGNWFDERTSEIEGINAKCFADPKKPYATVGFRYVMKISFFE